MSDNKKVKQGKVVKISGDKTVKVKVQVLKPHSKYGKVLRLSQNILAHDEKLQANLGDNVLIIETRPISKSKKWRLLEVTEKFKGEINGSSSN